MGRPLRDTGSTNLGGTTSNEVDYMHEVDEDG